jgi:hypothetical protein
LKPMKLRSNARRRRRFLTDLSSSPNNSDLAAGTRFGTQSNDVSGSHPQEEEHLVCMSWLLLNFLASSS